MKCRQAFIKKEIILYAFLLLCSNGFSQLRINNDLFKSDSAIVYIGIVNQFKINPREKIELVGGTRGIRLKQKNGVVEITSLWPGIFPVSFKTDIGVKKVVLISKTLTVQQIKSGDY